MPARRFAALALTLAAALAPAYGRVAVGHVHRRLGLLYEWTARAPERAYGPYLERIGRTPVGRGPLVVADDDPFNSPLRFYVHRARQRGRAVAVVPSARPFAPGTVVLTCAAPANAALARAYAAAVLDRDPPCVTLRVRGRRPAPAAR